MERLKFKFDIIAVSETHLNATSEKFANINGYKSLFNSRELKGWGGVGLFVRSEMVFLPRPDINILIEGIFESIFVEVVEEGRRYLVGSIYRPPNSDTNQFFQHLSSTLNKIKDKKSYILGDFNFDLLKYHENATSTEFFDELTSAGFQPLISLPSRVTSNSASIILEWQIDDL